MARALICILVTFVAVKCVVAPGRASVYEEYAQAGLDFWSGEPVSFVARQYLPYFSLAMSPLALLPDWLGQLTWALASLAVYLSGLHAFFRACVLPSLPGADEGRAWLAFLACGLGVGLSSLSNQQANTLIIGLLLWGSAFARGGMLWPAAACLVLPMFKAYPLALGMTLAVFRPHLAWRLGLLAAALLALPFLALPPAAAAERYQWIADYMSEGAHSLRFHLVGAREWLEQQGVSLSPGEFLPIQAAVGALIPLVLWLGGEGEAARERRAFVLVSLWFVTFGPSVEGPTYLLAAPALGWLLLRSWHRGAWTAFGFTLGLILICGPAQTSLFGLDAQRWMAQRRPACLALLLAFGWQLGSAATVAVRCLAPQPPLAPEARAA
jgi:hypothetical protein